MSLTNRCLSFCVANRRSPAAVASPWPQNGISSQPCLQKKGRVSHTGKTIYWFNKFFQVYRWTAGSLVLLLQPSALCRHSYLQALPMVQLMLMLMLMLTAGLSFAILPLNYLIIGTRSPYFVESTTISISCTQASIMHWKTNTLKAFSQHSRAWFWSFLYLNFLGLLGKKPETKPNTCQTQTILWQPSRAVVAMATQALLYWSFSTDKVTSFWPDGNTQRLALTLGAYFFTSL